MSDSYKISMTDLNGPASFGGGGERGGNRGLRDAVATGVCWTAGAAAGGVAMAGTAAVTKNPYASFFAGAAVGGKVGDICVGALLGDSDWTHN